MRKFVTAAIFVLMMSIIFTQAWTESATATTPATPTNVTTETHIKKQKCEYGNIYTTTATGYKTEQLLTPDGNIWNCGLEVLEGREYNVIFADNFTPSNIEDDIIIEFWLVEGD